MKAVLARRTAKGNGEERLNKSFGFLKHIRHKYEIGEEVGKGHFGHTCKGRCRKGELKGLQVAIKIISKSQMTTAIAIEDVKREELPLPTTVDSFNIVEELPLNIWKFEWKGRGWKCSYGLYGKRLEEGIETTVEHLEIRVERTWMEMFIRALRETVGGGDR
nr:CDPK-related kinase 5-like [Tanacetum cinerariifolium]